MGLIIEIDELSEATSLPIGIATVKLIVASEDTAIAQARELIQRTKSEINSSTKQQELSQLIETILLYKLPTITKEEMEEMFGANDLKQTRFYQEVFQEGVEQGIEQGIEQGEIRGKLKAVLPMLTAGFTLEQIAQALDLSIEEVRQAAQ